MDLATEWRNRRWRKLLNIIDHLPRDSAYNQALAEDEQLAAILAEQPEQPPQKPVRRMADWSPQVELLTLILDRVGELIHTVAAAHGAKPGKLQPAPRPVLAVERYRRQVRRRKHEDLVSRLLPHKRSE